MKPFDLISNDNDENDVINAFEKRLELVLSLSAQELVERIDEDVENAVATTEDAKSLLMKAYENASSNKSLYYKISGILVLFLLFFTLFVM